MAPRIVIIWISVATSQITLRHRRERENPGVRASTYTMPLFPFLSYLTVAMLVLIVVVTMFDPAFRNQLLLTVTATALIALTGVFVTRRSGTARHRARGPRRVGAARVGARDDAAAARDSGSPADDRRSGRRGGAAGARRGHRVQDPRCAACSCSRLCGGTPASRSLPRGTSRRAPTWRWATPSPPGARACSAWCPDRACSMPARAC
ncbi:hypothetical protein QJS66_11180 [Kocuria rhizophila]|nr:hypothetical protein QJS66_11180 [Kocuria rhizophila]